MCVFTYIHMYTNTTVWAVFACVSMYVWMPVAEVEVTCLPGFWTPELSSYVWIATILVTETYTYPKDCLSNDVSTYNGLHYISSRLTTQKDYNRRNH